MDIEMILNGGQMPRSSEYSPLSLAFIGDAVYEVFIRSKILVQSNAPANTLHKRCVAFVNCHAQSAAIESLCESLSEEEMWIFKRGRNAKTPTVPKNASVGEYHSATGFEALIGWLYLSKKEERAYEIMEYVYNFIKNQKN